jgi:hypothetical protein
MPYCTRADLYSFGLPRGALRNPGRPADASSAADDTITIDVHGFALDDLVSFRPEGGGRLPAPLVAGIDYFAIPVTESRFSVSATQGGAAIDLTTDGARFVVIAPLKFDEAITFGAAIIDDQLPAHCVPLIAPYPPIIVMTNAELAIGKLLNGSATASLAAMVDAATQRLARWAKGQPLRGTNTDKQTRANVAVSGNAPAQTQTSLPVSDLNGWNKFGGL